MTEHQFDEIFRNKLKDYSSQVPENFWQRIQPEDRDRKGFFFWLWCLIVPVCLLSGFASAFYYKSTRPATPSVSTNRLLISAIIPSVSVTNPSTLSVPAADPNSPTGLSAYPSVAPEHATSADTHTPASHSIYPTHSPTSYTYTRSSTAGTYTPATPVYHSVHLPATPARNTDNSLHSPLLPGIRHGLHQKSSPPIPSSGDSGALTLSQLPGITPIPNILHQPTVDKMQRTIAYPVNLPSKKLTPTNPSPKNNFLSSLKKGSWQLDVYASPDMPILQYKNSYQQSQLSFTTGLKVNRSFGGHFSGATGFQYSEVNTKINYYDSSNTGPISHTAHLKITSFELPLLIGYGIGNDRFRATLNTGVIFKIHSSGELHTTSTSLYFGLDLSKKINDKISLFAEPYYRYSLPGSYNSQYFTQRIHRTGLALGIRYNFMKPKQHKTYNVDQ